MCRGIEACKPGEFDETVGSIQVHVVGEIFLFMIFFIHLVFIVI